MKKLFLCLMALVAIVTLFGCSAKKADGSLEELMTKIYSGADAQYPMRATQAITPDMSDKFEYYFGTSNIKFQEALASDAIFNSIAHSVVLIRVSRDENVSALMDRIKKSNVGMKWICAGVPQNEVIVDNIGDLVVIIIDKDNPKALHNSFKKLAS